MFSEVYPNGMPWLVAQGNKNGYTTNYHANEPGSLLNYLWLSSGSGEQSFGCNGDNCGGSTPTMGHPITDDNIFRRLIAAGVTWKVYAESMPSGVDPTTIYESGAYVARHNPAVFYSDILTSSTQKQNIVPFTQFAKDLASNQLPAYSLIIPDVTHDAHDGSVGQADSWLASNVAPLLNHPSFQPGGDGLLIVTFDECDGAVGACNQQVYTAVIGPKVKPGTKSTSFYQHQHALRTILNALGISTYPGAAAKATDMMDFF